MKKNWEQRDFKILFKYFLKKTELFIAFNGSVDYIETGLPLICDATFTVEMLLRKVITVCYCSKRIIVDFG